ARVRRRRPRPLEVERLEDRLSPAVFSPAATTADGTSNGSLRADVITANGNGEDNGILLQAGTYNLTIPNSGGTENAAAQGALDLTAAGHTITFQGAGAGVTFLNANAIDRAFQVFPGVTAVFKDLTITGGLAQDDGSAGASPGTTAARGGAILN